MLFLASTAIPKKSMPETTSGIKWFMKWHTIWGGSVMQKTFVGGSILSSNPCALIAWKVLQPCSCSMTCNACCRTRLYGVITAVSCRIRDQLAKIYCGRHYIHLQHIHKEIYNHTFASEYHITFSDAVIGIPTTIKKEWILLQ